ncbi:hypothetical protein BZG36_00658 [Bifiguratus adelaidae]|uniref:Expansin-like EG45 domain-containing protein n=1 Tax=Bifiguratus adelaidae TaxID=1938954 RepID=A0A261Y6X5_9FUNG|nr:hypothetical protein BZG36_00658 [Bifiguratus adelaidae]
MNALTLLVVLLVSVIGLVSAVPEYHGQATNMYLVERELSNSTSLDKRGVRGTWYSGNDLKNAACYARNNLPAYNASPKSHICALASFLDGDLTNMGSGFGMCYKCVKVTNLHNHKSIIVRTVDKCAGCKQMSGIDLTPTAFDAIASDGLNEGVLNVKWSPVSCHSVKYINQWPRLPKY